MNKKTEYQNLCNELQKCPHCKGTAILATDNNYYWAFCNTNRLCGRKTKLCASFYEAVKDWNSFHNSASMDVRNNY